MTDLDLIDLDAARIGNDPATCSFSTAPFRAGSLSSTASRDFTPVNDASVVLPVLLRATNEDTGQQILTASDLLAGGTCRRLGGSPHLTS